MPNYLFCCYRATKLLYSVVKLMKGHFNLSKVYSKGLIVCCLRKKKNDSSICSVWLWFECPFSFKVCTALLGSVLCVYPPWICMGLEGFLLLHFSKSLFSLLTRIRFIYVQLWERSPGFL